MQITKSLSSLASVNGFSDLLKDYLSGNEALTPFYGHPPTLEGFDRMLASASFPRTNRGVLEQVTKAQYQKAGITPGTITQANLDKLKYPEAFTVCTGHQLCLFTGPLYFIYKIISTINLAEALGKKYPDHHFVPVFWMASEDHDFEEVNHARLFGKKLVWNKEEALGSIDSMPCGKISTHSLDRVFAELKSLLGNFPYAGELFEMLKNAYTKGEDLGDATRLTVDKLFGQYGLVTLDASDPLLKEQFVTIMKEELEQAPNEAIVRKSISDLEKAGYGAQVNPREINLFYMNNRFRGRIEKSKEGDGFVVINSDIRFSHQEILKELETNPAHFSPNVVLRPLYQQILLPNVAYVGGPGEIAYWLEYKAMFEKHKVPFPVLVPRNFVFWVDTNNAAKIEKLKLDIPTLSGNLPDLEKAYMQNQLDSSARLEEDLGKLTEVFGRIIQKALASDPTLKALAEAEFQKSSAGVKNLEAKMLKAAKQKHETALSQIRTIKEKLFPEGQLQERVDNFIPFYIKHGQRFLDALKQGLDPFEHDLIIFTEKE